MPENKIEIFVISSLLELIKSIKESLSFLNILYEESEVKGYDGQYLEFDSIFKEVNLPSQYQLLNLTFKDLFESGNYGNLAKNQGFNKLIKEICSSIINKNLVKGYKIDNITNLLQQKCGTFCSNHDILGYKIAENLHKCKEIIELNNTNSNHNYNGSKGEYITSQIISIETCNDMLKNLIQLLTSTNNLTPKAIKFLLNVCDNIDKNNLAQQYLDSGSNSTDYRKIYFDERMKLYDLIFEILIKFDEFKANDKLRSVVYSLIFKSNNDKIFQFTLYDWFINNGKSNDLLQLNNCILLEYLTRDDNEKSLDKRDLLWKYFIKLNKFIEASKVLFDLGIDDSLKISLGKRLEYLTRANGLSKTKNINTNVSELNNDIELYLSVANLQFEILNLLVNDTRPILEALKDEMVSKLADTKILSCDQLFNEFSEPLSYNEISLSIFQLTNFKDSVVILDNWTKFLDNFREFGNLLVLEKNFVKIGNKLNNNKYLFPVDQLIVLLIIFVNENFKDDCDIAEFITKVFINCGISFEKLYYQFKDLVVRSDNKKVVDVIKKSIQILIQKWYLKDLSLRDFIDNNDKNLKELIDKKEFDIKEDPIKEFLEN
ncbi:nucleoporin-domain-containing protein [Hanseniaspora valbyensis NRRL Y-1626]|uniref:Nucleoporin-domain-containing protein n=1 Tax=Hanseniaspora valbyensis NRRL Y-1626 TaxID=766949 RepID=A0A1B7T8B7_9ASCO|nr:nucleoporin-domain-containing protein [Hanseniaspora valbyensis NRRL Y-1626]